jgi:uncharacterized protein YndB with AHSA1/START domain
MPKNNFSIVAGISAEAVQAKTGKGWAEWIAILDKAGARTMAHKDIARYLSKEQGVPDWWGQMVTVGYEQARGLRAKHEKPEGYQISRSKTIAAPAAQLYAAWADKRKRTRWLTDAITIRTATPDKSLRILWGDGKTSLDVTFYPQGAGKCQVVVQHSQIASAKAAEKFKAYWAGALDALQAYVKGK